MGLDDETKFKLLFRVPEYHRSFYEFIKPKTFRINANFRIYKRQEKDKIFKVRIKLEEKHLSILEELKSEIKGFENEYYIVITKNNFFCLFLC